VRIFGGSIAKFDAPSRPGAYGAEADINRPMAPAQSVENHREWTYDKFTRHRADGSLLGFCLQGIFDPNPEPSGIEVLAFRDLQQLRGFLIDIRKIFQHMERLFEQLQIIVRP
jgi:hypothetical protein